jgi:hypothetical protein
METWKDIKLKGYQVSDLGRVRSVDRIVYSGSGRDRLAKGRVIKPSVSNSKYLFVSLTNQHKKFYVHRLVVEAFIGKIPAKKEVNHLNGNRVDNRPSNLEIISRSENLKHSHRILGNKIWNLKLNKDKAEIIRKEYYNKTLSQRQLARKFGVSLMVINRIINNVQYEYR